MTYMLIGLLIFGGLLLAGGLVLHSVALGVVGAIVLIGLCSVGVRLLIN